MRPREAQRDSRDFDTTSLHANHHGQAMHRDYTAHWHRWGFARRMIKKTDHVLEIGCGPEIPLWHMMFRGSFALCESYTGVDMNKLKGRNHRQSTFIGEFDFTSRYKELKRKDAGFDVAVHMEVIEHMKVEHGRKLLKGCFDLLRPGGLMLTSTPVYDGKRHAANHIHEYYADEYQQEIERAGFLVERRFGTFMDVRQIGKEGFTAPSINSSEIRAVAAELGKYYDNDALSCIFAPLYPDKARNNLWVCRKPEDGQKAKKVKR